MYNNNFAIFMINDIENNDTITFCYNDNKYWVHLYKDAEKVITIVVYRDANKNVWSINNVIDIDNIEAIYIDLVNGGVEGLRSIHSLEMSYLEAGTFIPPVRNITTKELCEILKKESQVIVASCIAGRTTYYDNNGVKGITCKQFIETLKYYNRPNGLESGDQIAIEISDVCGYNCIEILTVI